MHQNNGVQNFFFYLLCEGGSGNNDGIAYFVLGVGVPDSTTGLAATGIPDAGDLAYLALTGYMTTYPDHADARAAWLSAATELDELYGTRFYVNVILAWGAVGVGGSGLVLPDADFYSGRDIAQQTFSPSNKVYMVINPYTYAVTWSVTNSEIWVGASPSNFTLGPLSYTNMEIFIKTNALSLPEGVYTNTMTFTNMTTGAGSTTKHVFLKVVHNYRCVSTNFAWIDPVINGHTAIALQDDSVSGPYSIPFPVRYYRETYSNFYISANGMIGLINNGLTAYANKDIPTNSTPNGILCPFWDDLNPARGPGKMYWGVEGSAAATNRQVVVSWVYVAHYSDSDARFTFQAIIKETATTNENDIIFQYLNVAEDNDTYGAGRSATVGIEDSWGVVASKYLFNGSSWLVNTQALLFTHYPAPDSTAPSGTISVADSTLTSMSSLKSISRSCTGTIKTQGASARFPLVAQSQTVLEGTLTVMVPRSVIPVISAA